VHEPSGLLRKAEKNGAGSRVPVAWALRTVVNSKQKNALKIMLRMAKLTRFLLAYLMTLALCIPIVYLVLSNDLVVAILAAVGIILIGFRWLSSGSKTPLTPAS